MEERERMLDTIMAMQEFNIKKDKQIEELEQENQALKDRWKKLKEYVEKEKCKNIARGDIIYLAYAGAENNILNKMQKLEKEK